MGFGRRYGVLIIGMLLAAAGLTTLAARDYIDVTALPESSFVPLKSITFAIVVTAAAEVAFLVGVILAAGWIGVRTSHRAVGRNHNGLVRLGILLIGLALALVGGLFANSDRGEYLEGSPAHGIDFSFLALIVRYQLYQLTLVVGVAIVAGWIAHVVPRRRLR